MKRRTFLSLVGGGCVLAAGGVGAFAVTRTPHKALAPWTIGHDRSADPRLRALSYAILAPNPHNRQPWLVEMTGSDAFVLHADPARRLPETDPFDRQLTIGLGCFLELVDLAARSGGHRADIALFPDGPDADRLSAGPVAAVRLVPDTNGAADPLFSGVLRRRSLKEPFDADRAVPELAAQALIEDRSPAAAGFTLDSGRIQELRALAWEAHVIESTTPRTMQESVDLMRIGRAEIEASPDGIDLGGPFLEALAIAGLMTRETLADPESTAFGEGMRLYEEIHKTAMGYYWITTPTNSRHDQIAAGRAYVRANLIATQSGLGMHPVSQALQEYPEMAGHLAGLHAMLGAGDGQRVQMLARIGYGPETRPSPRWPLAARLTG
ncbi:MAG: twin-arginine translocation pathway signal protein [Pseudomonadota bacterium]